MEFRKPRWTTVAVAAVTAVLLVFGGVALAQSDGDTFTGCLSPSGQINRVAIGDEPVKRCWSESTQISWNSNSAPAKPLQVLYAPNEVGPYTVRPGETVSFRSECELQSVAIGIALTYWPPSLLQLRYVGSTIAGGAYRAPELLYVNDGDEPVYIDTVIPTAICVIGDWEESPL